jgi:hypothetical protein
MKKTCSAYFSKPIFFIVCQLQKKNNEENIKEDFSALTKSYFDGKMR